MYEKFEQITAEEEKIAGAYPYTAKVCMAAGCLSSQSDGVKKALEEGVGKHGCQIKGVGCMGLCAQGPLVEVTSTVDDETESVMYQNVKPADAEEIIASLGEKPVERLKLDTNVPFFQRQVKIVLENSGEIDPERIEEYIAADGYLALLTAVSEMEPNEVIDEIVTSGLRGRGGGGYPTGLKWTTVAKMDGPIKYIICNADEGDSGAFMDRTVLESDPHRVLEGMALAGYAVGATEGYIYVRGEYPLAITRLEKAIRQAKRMGILGQNVCGSQFNFNIEIRIGAGAFVCGEETALIASIEGKRGTPRPRPPIRLNLACGHIPPSSTTWKRLPMCHPFCAMAATGMQALAPPTAKAPRSLP